MVKYAFSCINHNIMSHCWHHSQTSTLWSHLPITGFWTYYHPAFNSKEELLYESILITNLLVKHAHRFIRDLAQSTVSIEKQKVTILVLLRVKSFGLVPYKRYNCFSTITNIYIYIYIYHCFRCLNSKIWKNILTFLVKNGIDRNLNWNIRGYIINLNKSTQLKELLYIFKPFL